MAWSIARSLLTVYLTLSASGLAGDFTVCGGPDPLPAKTDPSPLPQVVENARVLLQQYAAQQKIKSNLLLRRQDILFIRNDQDLRDLIETLIDAVKKASSAIQNEPALKAEMFSEFLARGAFTLSNRRPVLYNGASRRWQSIEDLIARGKATRVQYIIAADLAHESVHADGISDEVVACQAQLEVLQTFFHEGRFYLAAEIREVQQQCRNFQTGQRHGRNFPFTLRSPGQEANQEPDPN